MLGWKVRLERAFTREFARPALDVRVRLIGHFETLEEFGPDLGRPLADTLRNSASPI